MESRPLREALVFRGCKHELARMLPARHACASAGAYPSQRVVGGATVRGLRRGEAKGGVRALTRRVAVGYVLVWMQCVWGF